MPKEEQEEVVETHEDEEIDLDADVVNDLEDSDSGVDPNDNDKEKEVEKEDLEPWMSEDAETDESVPLGSHVKAKHKLKGVISDRDDEIARLKSELEEIKNKPNDFVSPGQDIGKRPREEDYDDFDKYQSELDVWEDRRANERYARIEESRKQKHDTDRALAETEKRVEDHYGRAADLVKKYKIDPEIYKQSDRNFREAIGSVVPTGGDKISDGLISRLGEGSEKAIYALGRNKSKLDQFKGLLASDKTGFEAAIYLGKILGESTQKQKIKSSAPSPAPDIDTSEKKVTVSASSLKKQFDRQNKAGNGQKAFQLYKKAKNSGVDVSKWG